MSKTKELPSRKKITLQLLHKILGHRSNIMFLAGDTSNVWEDMDKYIEVADGHHVTVKQKFQVRIKMCDDRCGSEYHMIAKCPKPSKDNDKRRKQVRFNEKGNPACDNSKNNDDHKIYASMARMYRNDERSS